MEIIQHKFFGGCISKFRHSNHSNRFTHPLTCTNHTYPTGRLFWMAAVPGTSCQATIVPSLRDKSLWGRRALRVCPGTSCQATIAPSLPGQALSGRCALRVRPGTQRLRPNRGFPHGGTEPCLTDFRISNNT